MREARRFFIVRNTLTTLKARAEYSHTDLKRR
nr:MAG TPA: hypothetical protein [Caudoviricetes sp.]